MIWLITVKLPKNPAHDPKNKKTGPCPVNGLTCTDQTGEHHTVADAGTMEEMLAKYASYHITRLEQVK